MKPNQHSFLIFTFVLGLTLSSCGGGSSGSSDSNSSDGGGSGAVGNATAALTVAEKVSVVDAQNSSESALVKALNRIKKAVSALPGDSDYNNDETFTFVNERSAEAFDTVNEILCMMAQTKYDEMLNQGDYKAQIDVTQCKSDNDDAQAAAESTQNQTSSTNVPSYEMWVVNSYRADDNAGTPHILSAWISQEASEWEPAQTIFAKVTITEKASENNPYGIFHMNFNAIGTDTGTELMTGYLRTVEDSDGQIALQFYNNGNLAVGSFTEQVTLNRSADGSVGTGTIAKQETFGGNTGDGDSAGGKGLENLMKEMEGGSESKSFNIAYNDNYFFRSDESDNEVCLNRNSFNETVYRYNLYNNENSTSPGSRLAMQSGFPIKFTSGNNTYHGYIGYHGLWMPEDAGLSSGDTVEKQAFGPGGEAQGESYEVFIVNGKLVRHTKGNVTLAEIAGVPLQWSQCNMDGCTQYRVEWDKEAQKLYKTGYMDQENWFWNDMDPSEITFGENDFDFGFWSEALGGEGRINLRIPQTGELVTLSNESNVIFHTNVTVAPGDTGIPATFACFNECLDPSTISTDHPHIMESTWEAGDAGFEKLAHETAPEDLVAGINYAPYSFDSESMLLSYNGEPVVLEEANESNPWGVHMGALVDANALADLACDWDASQSCPWKLWEQDEFYTWETGANDWNRLSLLKAPGTNTFLSFDPPKMVEYTNADGIKYYLNYEGDGNLQGIPGKCVNQDTGEDINCSEGMDGNVFVRWVPQFSIASGSAVTDVATDAVYYVKALEKEQQMRAVDTAACSDAGLELSTHELPDGSNYSAPDIGDVPVIDAPPAVIGGVVQI